MHSLRVLMVVCDCDKCTNNLTYHVNVSIYYPPRAVFGLNRGTYRRITYKQSLIRHI